MKTGWHCRGYLPHLDAPGRTQAITFRLADSVPRSVIKRWQDQLRHRTGEDRNRQLRRWIALFEDRGIGRCWLRHREHAEWMVGALHHSDGKRYRLDEWCVMPNHVHVIIAEVAVPLEVIVRSWKSYTAKLINRRVGRDGRLWDHEYFDRLIRDEDHLWRARRYVRNNPVKAGLCERPEDWVFSSAAEG